MFRLVDWFHSRRTRRDSRAFALGQGTRHDPRTFGDDGGLPVAGQSGNQPVSDGSDPFHASTET